MIKNREKNTKNKHLLVKKFTIYGFLCIFAACNKKYL